MNLTTFKLLFIWSLIVFEFKVLKTFETDGCTAYKLLILLKQFCKGWSNLSIPKSSVPVIVKSIYLPLVVEENKTKRRVMKNIIKVSIIDLGAWTLVVIWAIEILYLR